MLKIITIFLAVLTLCSQAYAQEVKGTVRVNLGAQTLYDGQSTSYYTDPHGAIYFDCYVGCSGSGTVAPAPYQYTPVTGTQSALSVTTATSLTVPATAQYATITPIGGAVYCSTNADFTPTATTGLPLAAGSVGTFSGYATLTATKCIDATGSTATLFVQYSK